MAFCSECGNKLGDGAKFCSKCGAMVITNTRFNQRRQVFEGVIHKCPNCGEIISSFTTVCSSCGYELRGTHPSNVVKELQVKLEKLEESRKEAKGSLLSILTLDIYRMSSVDKQKVNLIRSFAITNNKEEIYEFMILAASNLDTSEGVYNSNAYYPGEQAANRALTSAWEAKMDQAYEKARLVFGEDPDFDKIKEVYNNKKRAVKAKNLRYSLSIIVPMTILLIVLVGSFSALSGMTKSSIERRRAEEESLNAVVEEVMQDVSDGDYDSALMKANNISYDESLSKERAAQWDERRENLIEMINEKKAEIEK